MNKLRNELIELINNNKYSISKETEGVVNQLCEMLEADKKDDITEVLNWLEKKRSSSKITISEIPINDLSKWKVDKITGNISHISGRFFQIVGIKIEGALDREVQSWSQPIMKQEECGILGIICKNIEGIRHYLLWAKYLALLIQVPTLLG